ncbi:MAG: hypothetical protein IPJ01_07260 [Micavibrio sp.]|nr:hypothetical protein [Micavibrio sp.]MBK9562508.1 hypothetical protein [Micavibrio sp.]
MNILKRIGQWFDNFISSNTPAHQYNAPKGKEPPPVVFAALKVTEKPPKNENISEQDFYYVAPSNKPKWALFKCPCGCGDVITLSMQPVHRPFWRLQETASRRPSLYPSVWRDKGCMSHFWLKDGRIFWVHDTGTSPFYRDTA